MPANGIASDTADPSHSDRRLHESRNRESTDVWSLANQIGRQRTGITRRRRREARMLQASIRIEGRDHFLPPGDGADEIMSRITEQLRAGGGFVEIIRTPDRSVRVLVSPGVSLSIEVTDVDEDPSEPS